MEAGARQRLHPESLSQFQGSIQEKIKDYDLMAQQHARDEKRISRRDALKAIADFPLLAYGVMGLGAERLAYLACTEEVLPFCAAGLTACQALLTEGDMTTIARVLRTYLPTLEFMARQPSASQPTAAYLASQGFVFPNE